MKIYTTDGRLTVTAESVEDIAKLMAVSGLAKVQSEDRAFPGRRKHKKHNHKKTCTKCEKEFKGLQGLAVHNARMHGGEVAATEENKSE